MGGGSTPPHQLLSLPQGGGGQRSIGEHFTADLHTGSGTFVVPIALPRGRNGFQPDLALTHSAGDGNGPLGIGWKLSLPAIARKTSDGVPRYDATDTFVLAGGEDLVPIGSPAPGVTRFRPRTDTEFALIDRYRGAAGDQWVVREKNGRTYRYERVLTRPLPGLAESVYRWHLSTVEDPFGNRIAYDYRLDSGGPPDQRWAQVYPRLIRYVDYSDEPGETKFLVSVELLYDDNDDLLGEPGAKRRPDAFSEFRSGFEIRTRRRCRWIVVRSHAERERLVRAVKLTYLDERTDVSDDRTPPNGASLLSLMEVLGFGDDGVGVRELAPLEFKYSTFRPERRRFAPVTGANLPVGSLSDPRLRLADLTADGLPDILEMNGVARVWRNIGGGRFELPRRMPRAPPVALDDPRVRLLDADGDGRIELVDSGAGAAGYYPLDRTGRFDRRGLRRQRYAPSFTFADPEVELVDLTGSGVTDVLRTGTRLECYFNDRGDGFSPRRVRRVARRTRAAFPDVSFSDPRVHLADMNGDGLRDVVLVHDGNLEYWPSMGHGDWGRRVHMTGGPNLPVGHDPGRLLLGDVDGDGLADLVYVGEREVSVWINRGGIALGPPITVGGTPAASGADTVQLVDLLGTGTQGVLWSGQARADGRPTMFFLDLTGGAKPYLLTEMDNHSGAVTRVAYAPSTTFLLADRAKRRPSHGTLPFPVQVVQRVDVVDSISHSTLTTEYRYHHGHWDGEDRRFCGFGCVEQFDGETRARTWFHLGAVPGAAGAWVEASYRDEYWEGDPPLLEREHATSAWLAAMPPAARHAALRALRGSMLRTEVYGTDAGPLASRPFHVTEHVTDVREETTPALGGARPRRVFFPFVSKCRTTRWERGDDPMTSFTFAGGHDQLGRPVVHTEVGLPRRSARRDPAGGDETDVLAIQRRAVFATPDPGLYIHDRIAHQRVYALVSPGGVPEQQPGMVKQVLADQARAAAAVVTTFGGLLDGWEAGTQLPPEVRLVAHVVDHYDGDAYRGRDAGELGPHGALTRSESLTFTADLLARAFGGAVPAYLGGSAELPPGAPPGFGIRLGYREEIRSPLGYHDGWYSDTVSCAFDVQLPDASTQCGLLVGTQDPLGNRSTLKYDRFGLLGEVATDSAGLQTTSRFDYRVMRPADIAEPNGAKIAFSYTPVGLSASSSTTGRAGSNEGDQARAGTEISYDLRAFYERGEPMSTRTRRRVHHDTETDVPLPRRDHALETVEYTDGFGRPLQMRTLAEDVIFDDPELAEPLFGDAGLSLDQSDAPRAAAGQSRIPGGPPNVVVTGWRRYDNKGRLSEQKEPYYATGWGFDAAAEEAAGVATRHVHDATGFLVQSVAPDGSEQWMVKGTPGDRADLSDPASFEPTPWEIWTYDANDNAGRAAPGLASGCEHHVDTPSSVRLDAFGRMVLAIERLRGKPRPGQPLAAPSELRSRFRHDIDGTPIEVTDARGVLALRRVSDLRGRALLTRSADMAVRTDMFDAADNLVDQRDAKGAVTLRTYDSLSRLTRLLARDHPLQALTLRVTAEYGDGGTSAQPAAERAAAAAAYRLGRLHRFRDGAGVLTTSAYDFKGNARERLLQAFGDAALLAPLAAAAPDAPVPHFIADWAAPVTAGMLEPDVHGTEIAYDALNRLKWVRMPLDVDAGGNPQNRKLLRLGYNAGGMVDRATLDGRVIVERIAYNARGQRTLVAYGRTNGRGVMTRFAYDPRSFRLRRLRSEPYTSADMLTLTPAGTALQDVAHRWDPAGNLLELRDRTPAGGIPLTPLGANALDRHFVHDSLYRLTEATGREARGPAAAWPPDRRASDPADTRAYVQWYAYDDGGNLERLTHQTAPAGGGFERVFTVSGAANRLTSAVDAGVTRTYEHDRCGNLTQEGADRHFAWDHDNRLASFRRQAPGAPLTVFEQYLYDGGGERVKKVEWRGTGDYDSTLYVDELFERRVRVRAGATVRQDLLHIIDGERRVASLRCGPELDGGTPDPLRYCLTDHLDSVTVVTNSAGEVVAREEYSPFGETTLGGSPRVRERFTGSERDEGSGLSDHGARLLAPWLGRWTSPDPIGVAGGLNAYAYVSASPMARSDPGGTQETEPLRAAPSPSPVSSEDLEAARGEFLVGVVVGLVHDAPQQSMKASLGLPGLFIPSSVIEDIDRKLFGELGFSTASQRLTERYDTSDKGTGSWNPLFTALAEMSVADASVGRGLDLMAFGRRDAAMQAFGTGGFRYAAMIQASVNFANLAAGAAGAATVAGSALMKLRTHIVYVFRDGLGRAVYVGRASGWGDPLRVIWGRVRKGHEIVKAHPHLRPQVLSQHASRDAAMGSEGMNHDYFLELAKRGGYEKLFLNSPKSPPLSRLPAKAEKTLKRINAWRQGLRDRTSAPVDWPY